MFQRLRRSALVLLPLVVLGTGCSSQGYPNPEKTGTLPAGGPKSLGVSPPPPPAPTPRGG
jgi:hypothetical protein